MCVSLSVDAEVRVGRRTLGTKKGAAFEAAAADKPGRTRADGGERLAN